MTRALLELPQSTRRGRSPCQGTWPGQVHVPGLPSGQGEAGEKAEAAAATAAGAPSNLPYGAKVSIFSNFGVGR